MNRNTLDLQFALLRSALHGELLLPEERELLTEDMIPALATMAKHHDLSHLLALGLKTNGLLPKDAPALGNEIMKAVFRYEQLQYDLTELCRALEEAEIDFIPLKGSVLRRHYPEPWMRTSCDIDVLVHAADLDRAVAALTDTLGYTAGGKNSHDISLHTPSQMHVELHYDLVEDGRANGASEVLEGVWDTSIVKEGMHHHREMPDEMFYFYHIAHMAKHFENGGCGIRPFIDLWILDRLESADQSKRDDLLRKGNLLQFAEVSRALSRVWMDGVDHTDLTAQMEHYILRGGVYGTTENRVTVQQQKRGGRLKYAVSRIFLSYHSIKYLYPILQKHRWLTPAMEVHRWFKLAFGGRAKRAMRELKLNNEVTRSEAESTRKFLGDIGL